jgi:hypothetical protein
LTFFLAREVAKLNLWKTTFIDVFTQFFNDFP